MAFPLSAEEHTQIKQRIESQPELVVAAAIRVKLMSDWTVILMVERPERHAPIISFLHRSGLDYKDQGFITNHGRFVDRVEAAEIVRWTGQGSKSDHAKGLFSEDMWNDE